VSSARDLITRSLKLLGVLQASEVPTADDLDDGFVMLNEFISDLATQRATIFTVSRNVHALTGGQQQYTIGPGGMFNQQRPLWIDNLSVIPDRGASPILEYPIGPLLSLDQFQRIAVKSIGSRFPLSAYYDYGFEGAGLGRISVYPIPQTDNTDLVLYTPVAMQSFVDLTTEYAFPPGYERMVRYNLAVEMAPEWDASPSPDVLRRAETSLANIKRANTRLTDLQFDVALTGRNGRRFNVYSGV
jgi:hypothetical protein